MPAFRRWSAAAGIGLLAVSTAAITAEDVKLLRERPAQERPTILIVGSGHFANPGNDLVNDHVEDVLTERRQKELTYVVEQLATFRPTHIAIERAQSTQAALSRHYLAFVEGRETLSRDEGEQLGLRLAAKLGHEGVFAVDWNERPIGDVAQYDWPAYGRANGQKDLVSALVDPERTIGLVPLDRQTIGAWLLELNHEQTLAANHRNYFDIARIGSTAQQPGAHWVASWYGRNLRIFNNIVQLTNRGNDRVLVIFGHGHAYLLRQFARESGAFRVVDVADVLREP